MEAMSKSKPIYFTFVSDFYRIFFVMPIFGDIVTKIWRILSEIGCLYLNLIDFLHFNNELPTPGEIWFRDIF